MKPKKKIIYYSIFHAIILISILIGMYYPLSPVMPAYGLDAGWAYAMNEAVASGKRIGTEIIFTFGPWASVYTHMFHPGTEHLMTLGSIYLIAIAFLLFLPNLHDSKSSLFLTSLFAASFFISRDVMLFAIPLMFSVAVFSHHNAPPKGRWFPRTYYRFAIFFGSISLGLLPLIKGSLAPYVLVTIFVTAGVLISRKSFQLAAATAFLPAFSTIFFWHLSGQDFTDIGNYFESLVPIIFGYSDAMGKSGSKFEEAVYVVILLSICFTLFRCLKLHANEKFYLVFSVFLYGFFCFKAGYTRHDGHGYIATFALVFLLVILFPITTNINDKKFKVITSAALSLFLVMYFKYGFDDRNFKNIAAEKGVLDKATKNSPLVHKVRIITEAFSMEEIFRIAGSSFYLKNFWIRDVFSSHDNVYKFEESKRRIIEKCGFDFAPEGSVDIFTVHQECALANDWTWNPRPIFQSYSAYSGTLLKSNQKHYLSPSAPDSVVFQMNTIDGRLPNAEDTLAQFELYRGYRIDSVQGDALLLRRASKKRSVEMVKSTETQAEFGKDFPLPAATRPLFMTIEVSPSLVGKILGIFYKNNHVSFEITLNSGEKKKYRIIPAMINSPFIIIPHIENINDFRNLVEIPLDDVSHKIPASARIDTDAGFSGWIPKATMKFYELQSR